MNAKYIKKYIFIKYKMSPFNIIGQEAGEEATNLLICQYQRNVVFYSFLMQN